MIWFRVFYLVTILNRCSSSPTGWRVSPRRGCKSFGIMHIPKTAGTSFVLDAPAYLRRCQGLYAKECCLSQFARHQNIGVDRIMTFVRDPVAHVYSQYLELADTKWGNSKLDHRWATNSSRWLSFFAPGVTQDPGGYHPYNMQTRSFVCRKQQHHHSATHLTDDSVNMKQVFLLA